MITILILFALASVLVTVVSHASAEATRYQLANDEYFMLGDNSPHSKDSRLTGPVKEADLIGVVRAIYWPASRWRSFD